MVQLRVENNGEYIFLDLYDTEPIKLTLSIEDITSTEARSVFSRSFRVPSTGKNNQFFDFAFLVEGVDFDVTQRKSATILVDGAEFKSGHVRLQRIIRNKSKDSIEYEIVFMGETRDFATALSDKRLTDLDLSEYDHPLDYAHVTDSWQAYPEGGLTDGLFNGDILYPLIDFGDTEGQGYIGYTGNTADGGFNHTQNAITAGRFKPMIRAKALWDKIFEEAGFTYTSNIANSPDFTQLYVSAFGNDPGKDTNNGSANELNAALTNDYYISGIDTILWDNEILDPSDNYNPTTGAYTVPGNGTYTINVRVDGDTRAEAGGGVIKARIMKNGVLLGTEYSLNIASNDSRRWLALMSFTGLLALNDEITVEVEEAGDIDRTIVYNTSYFKVPSAPGDVGFASLFDDDYKQVDFIKDMITKFRLVLAPDKNNSKNFIVETWSDYIGSGELYDWTDKVDHNKDFVIEPVFFAQSDRLRFEDKADGDWLNTLNEDKFKETFGTLRFDSGNDLLIGERKIETGFAPTPITQIRGAADSNFLIPLIHTHETEDVDSVTVLKHEPIKPITRLLFYNGLFTQAKDTAWPSNEGRWFFYNEATLTNVGQTQFPMVSYWQNFDAVTGPGDTSVNLNWQIEDGYANPHASFNYTGGIGMFDRFWSDYIQSVYNKFARKVTCYVVLETVDTLRLSFDDVIFIDGTYYRPEKVTDIIVGERSVAKVELIKILNYQLDQPLPGLEMISMDPGSEIGTGGDQPVDGGSQVTTNYYVIRTCANPGDPIVASYAGTLTQGQSVTTTADGGVTCYEVIDAGVAPSSVTVLGVFPDCASCNE